MKDIPNCFDKICISYENWLKYADSVNDFNPVHRDSSFARKYNLFDVISPGMFVASHIERYGKVYGFSNILFFNTVYDNTNLFVEEVMGRRGGLDYVFSDGLNEVCKVLGVNKEGYDESVPCDLKNVQKVYSNDVGICEVNDFLDSIGVKEGFNSAMYLASMSSNALRAYGETKRNFGMHVAQSFRQHKPMSLEPVGVVVGNESNAPFLGREMVTYQLRWVQGDNCIASGRSIVRIL